MVGNNIFSCVILQMHYLFYINLKKLVIAICIFLNPTYLSIFITERFLSCKKIDLRIRNILHQYQIKNKKKHYLIQSLPKIHNIIIIISLHPFSVLEEGRKLNLFDHQLKGSREVGVWERANIFLGDKFLEIGKSALRYDLH